MPAKDPLVYLMHIRDCCRRIAEYTSTGGADWPANALIMDAVCRNITIIGEADRKSTRLNSSHLGISYAVFCLKKKNCFRIPEYRDICRACVHLRLGDAEHFGLSFDGTSCRFFNGWGAPQVFNSFLTGRPPV